MAQFTRQWRLEIAQICFELIPVQLYRHNPYRHGGYLRQSFAETEQGILFLTPRMDLGAIKLPIALFLPCML